jgi:hypothetical protein
MLTYINYGVQHAIYPPLARISIRALLEKQSITQTIQRSFLLVPANTQATSLREQGVNFSSPP